MRSRDAGRGFEAHTSETLRHPLSYPHSQRLADPLLHANPYTLHATRAVGDHRRSVPSVTGCCPMLLKGQAYSDLILELLIALGRRGCSLAARRWWRKGVWPGGIIKRCIDIKRCIGCVSCQYLGGQPTASEVEVGVASPKLGGINIVICDGSTHQLSRQGGGGVRIEAGSPTVSCSLNSYLPFAVQSRQAVQHRHPPSTWGSCHCTVARRPARPGPDADDVWWPAIQRHQAQSQSQARDQPLHHAAEEEG